MHSIADFQDKVLKCLAGRQDRSAVIERIHSAKTSSVRFQAIKEFYALALPEILEQPAHIWGIDPYEADWCRLMTPIEFGLWQNIRAEGAVFYPQFPVDRFFVDFGNPRARVAIECDGEAFHQDHERDLARQRIIEGHGWTVYRITGRECMVPDRDVPLDEMDEDDRERLRYDWREEARQFIPNIARAHGLSCWALHDPSDPVRCW